MLPECCVQYLQRQIECVRQSHEQDLSDGFGKVYLPHALARKYPNANREFCWQSVSRHASSRRTHAVGKHGVTIFARKRSEISLRERCKKVES